MKLEIISEALFDEFPNDPAVKYCFFTQPKYPADDYRGYRENVTYCGSEATLQVMSAFTKLSIKHFRLMTDRKEKFKYTNGNRSFHVRALRTGQIGANPVMYFIYIGDAIHLYTGEFSKCRQVLMNPLIYYNYERIKDVYVDNTVAGLKQPCQLMDACSQIKEIVSAHDGYKIFLHVDVFGYEELLYELAQNNGIKIQMIKIQKYLFEQCGLKDAFEYDGEPQLIVWARFSETPVYTQRQYKRMFETKKTIHIKLIVCQHKLHWREQIKGLIMIPYTPHANAFELYTLFQTLNFQRIHRIIKRSYADDQLSTIPLELLTDDCKIVDDEDFPEFPQNNNVTEQVDSHRTFLDLTQDSEDLDGISLESVSGPVCDWPSADKELSQKSAESVQRSRTTVPDRTLMLANDEVITIDDDDDDDDDGGGDGDSGGNDDDDDEDDLELMFKSPRKKRTNRKSTKVAPKTVGKMDVNKTKEQATNPKESQPKTSSETSLQQQPDAAAPSASTTADQTVDANAVQSVAPSVNTESPTDELIPSNSSDANNNQSPSAKKSENEQQIQQQQQTSTVAPTKSTALNRTAGKRSGVGGKKRKFVKQMPPVYRQQQIQYLPSSDDDEVAADVDQNKRLRLEQKENNDSPARSGVKASANNQNNQTNVRRLSEIDENVVQTENRNSNRQHGTSANGSHNNNNNNNAKTTFDAAQRNAKEIKDKNCKNMQVQKTTIQVQRQNNNSPQSSDDSDSDSDSTSCPSLESLVFPEHY